MKVDSDQLPADPPGPVIVPTQPAEPSASGDGRSVQRLVSVLEFVADRATGQAPGVVEVARGVGLEKSVVSRLLRTMSDAGLLSRDDALGYRVGPRLFALTTTAQDARLVELGQRVVGELVDMFDERAEVFTRNGNRAVTLVTAAPRSALQVAGWVGLNCSLTSTAAGRALLFDHDADAIRRLVEHGGIGAAGPRAPIDAADIVARLAADKERGVALSVEETDRDLLGIAVPVRGALGRILASVVISGPVERLHPQIGTVSAALLDAAARMSTQLGGSAVHDG